MQFSSSPTSSSVNETTTRSRSAEKCKVSILKSFGKREANRKPRPSSLFSSPRPRTLRVSRRATHTQSESPDLAQNLTQNLNNHSSNAGNSVANRGKPPRGLPIVIQRLPPLQNTFVPKNPEKFTKREIMAILGGTRVANHCYTVQKPKPGLTKKVKGYYLIDTESNPFAPSYPGQHGAAISSLIIPSGDLSEELPLFVNDGSGFYTYCGDYVEPRYSDMIGFNEMCDIIPEKIKQYHAKDICTKSNGGKKKNAIVALKDQWPMKPLGWYQEDTKIMEEYDEAQEWERHTPCSAPISDEEAEAIKYEEIMDAFERVSNYFFL